MKSAESHTTQTHHSQPEAAQGPFFRADGHERAFFGGSQEASVAEPFFNSGIQAKLTVGQPNDRYEQEADRTADQVVQRLAQSESSNAPATEAPPISSVAPSITPIQRTCATCGAELDEGHEDGATEEPLQRKPAFDGGDTPPEEEGTVQRKCAACAEQERLQTKSEQASTPSADLESRLAATKGSGSHLPAATRSQMEGAIGADFSGVRVHTDGSAVQMSQELGAQAFTHGNDVYFNSGKYDPGGQEGQHLLAHELTHVVQQGGQIRRREFGPIEAVEEMQDGDWRYADRLNETGQWKKANIYNLINGHSSAYTQIDVRRDFYGWFYAAIRAKGHEVRWPLAAYVVAGGANEGANRDPAGINAIRGNKLEQLLRRGNQVIFDDVFSKLRQLYLQDNILTGEEALAWDMRTLIEEQNLIQPLYEDMSEEDLETMASIARQEGFFLTIGSALFGRASGGEYHEGGYVPSFPDSYDLTDPGHRFRYGMMLAHYFTSENRDVSTSQTWAEGLTAPQVPESYQSGEALREVDRMNPVHELSSVMTDSGANRNQIRDLIHQLNDEQRRVIINDPWYTAILRHRQGMSMAEALALLSSTSIEECGPTFQVIGMIEGTGEVKAEDQIIVIAREGTSWRTTSGGERIQVQAISQPAIDLFTGVPLRYVWKDSLHCYPRRQPDPIPEPIDRSFQIFFDTGNSNILDDTHEFENRIELNRVLLTLAEYGENPLVDDIDLFINGHASPRWRSAPDEASASVENEGLARSRADHTLTFIERGYNEYEGAIPLVVLNPSSEFSMVLENPLPTDGVFVSGSGSIQGLSETGDPDNDDQIYRRVDIRIYITFQ